MLIFSRLKFLFLSVVLFSISSSYCYGNMVSVGDAYEGGIVFCVDPNLDPTQCSPSRCVPFGKGHCGLIMSNEDLANLDSPNKGVKWASEYKDTGALSDDVELPIPKLLLQYILTIIQETMLPGYAITIVEEIKKTGTYPLKMN